MLIVFNYAILLWEMSWDRPAAAAPAQRRGVSPERIGISGVLWSTLWGCVCVQLGKIHGHSSLFRLQQSGRKGQQRWAKTLLDEDKESQNTFHTHSQPQQQTTLFISLSLRFCCELKFWTLHQAFTSTRKTASAWQQPNSAKKTPAVPSQTQSPQLPRRQTRSHQILLLSSPTQAGP